MNEKKVATKIHKKTQICVPLCNFVAKKEAGGLNGLI